MKFKVKPRSNVPVKIYKTIVYYLLYAFITIFMDKTN